MFIISLIFITQVHIWNVSIVGLFIIFIYRFQNDIIISLSTYKIYNQKNLTRYFYFAKLFFLKISYNPVREIYSVVSSCLFMRKHFLAGCTYHNLPNTLRRVMFRFIVVVNSPNWPLTITTFDRPDFFPNSRFDVQRFCYAVQARRKRRCWNTLIPVQRPEMNWIFTVAK